MGNVWKMIADSAKANIIALEYMRRCPNGEDEKIVKEKLANAVKRAYEFLGIDCSKISRYFPERGE